MEYAKIGTAKGPGQNPHEFLFISPDSDGLCKVGEFVFYVMHGVEGQRPILGRIVRRAPVRLAPCPSYTEYLGVFSGPGQHLSAERHYYLNCAAVRQIAAHGSVTFVMCVPVPAAAGQAKLDWQLQETNVATAMGITIRSRSR